MYRGLCKSYTYKVDNNGKVVAVLFATVDTNGNICRVHTEYTLDMKGYNVYVDAFIDGVKHFEATGEEPERNVCISV